MRVARWLIASTVVGLLALLITSLRPTHPLPSLDVGIDDKCREVELGADGRTLICTLDPLRPTTEQHLQVLVRQAADADLQADCAGCTMAACKVPTDSAADVQCRELSPGPGREQLVRLRLLARGKTLGERTIRLVLPPLTPIDELQRRWRKTGGELAPVQALLPDAQTLAEAQPAGELRDRATILFARILNDELLAHDLKAGPNQQAEATLARLLAARLLANQRQWFRSAADLTEVLIWHYRYRPGALEKIEALLVDQPWLPLLPTRRMSCYRLVVGAALEQQDLRRANEYLDKVRPDAAALHDSTTSGWLVELRTAALEQLALTASRYEVEKGLREFGEAAKHADTPCDQAYIWGSIGWIRLLLWELGWPDAQDPMGALTRAEELRQHQCPGSDEFLLANVQMNLARARSASFWRLRELDEEGLRAASAATRKALDALRAGLGEHPLPDRLRGDWLLVEARLNLFDGKPELARANMEELLHRPASDRSPLLRWLATVQLADAQEAGGHTEAALGSFRQAERLLLTLQGQVPIYQSHRLMLERYEYSSQRAVALALRLGRPAEALEVIRLAHQRAPGLTAIPSPEQTATDPRWAQHRSEQAEYESLRRAYESQLAHAGALTAAQCQELAAAKSHWLRRLDAVFRTPAPELFVPPAPPPTELLIGCAQQRPGWVCIGTRNGAFQVVPIARPELNREAVEQVLLPALAPMVQQAAKIRVLAHDALAQLDVAALRLSGRPLGTLKPIRYAVDQPLPPPLPAPRQALVVINPEDNIPDLALDRAHQLLAPALRGLDVTARSATATFGAPPAWMRGEAHSAEILTDLQHSDVLFFLGHVEPMPCPTHTPLCSALGSDALQPDQRLTALCLTQHTALSAGDLLVAPRVPQQAFLLGCDSADRRTKSPTEMLGLAQALALRGSQVLAIARSMPAVQAAEVLCALGLLRLSEPNFDMDRFVMDTQSRLQRGERCVARGTWHTPQCPRGGCPEVDWSALRSYGP